MSTGINEGNGSIGGNGQPQVADLHVQEVIRSADASFRSCCNGGRNS